MIRLQIDSRFSGQGGESDVGGKQDPGIPGGWIDLGKDQRTQVRWHCSAGFIFCLEYVNGLVPLKYQCQH